MADRLQFIPAHVFQEVEQVVLNDELPSVLVDRGLANSVRTAQKWVAAYKSNNFKTTLDRGHYHTKNMDDYDPTAELQGMIVGEQVRFRSMLQKYCDTGKDLYFVIKSDTHVPDNDPVACELGRRLADYWLQGQENKMVLDNGDKWDFPSISRHQNVVPFWLMYPGCSSPGDYMMLTMEADNREEAAWADVCEDRVQLAGNHCNRFVRFMFMHAPQMAQWSLVAFMEQIKKQGVTWLNMGTTKIRIREDFEILHGTYSRQGAGASVAAQMQADAHSFRYTVQGHVHRSGYRPKTALDGRVVHGYEVGCLANLRPLYSQNNIDWQQGIMLGRINLSRPETAAEIFNLTFERNRDFLTCQFDGQEFVSKYPQKFFDNTKMRNGDFSPVVPT